MTQRTVIAVLGTLCLALLGYLAGISYLGQVRPAEDWERGAELYVREYHGWLSTSPASGWARVEALAESPERERIEKLRPSRQEPSPWGYSGGSYRLLAQGGGRALVQASYTLRSGQRERSVEETYLLGNSLGGIKVVQLIGGRCQP